MFNVILISGVHHSDSVFLQTKVKAKCSSISRIQLFETPRTIVCQFPLSMAFPRQEYWPGLPFPSLGHLSNSGIEPESPASPILQVDSLLLSHMGSLIRKWMIICCCCCCCWVTSVVSNSLWPRRWQPSRLRHPWDSPGKNTGVGCHFLLQCMKVKSESEVIVLIKLAIIFYEVS